MFAKFVNHSKLDEATSTKDAVAPVYLLEEIWELIHTSGPEVSAGLVDLAIKRLNHRSPIVKHKTLRLIKHICAKGSSDFKRGLTKQAGPIRELTHYRGEPDPFKGDVMNQRVRDKAKEALEAVFAATDVSRVVAPPPLQNRIQGFGSAVSSAEGAAALAASAGSSGGARMLGFGNPHYEGGGGAGRPGRVTSPKALIDAAAAALGGSAGAPRRAPFMREEGGYSSGEDASGGGRARGPPRVAAVRSALRGASGSGGGGEEGRAVEALCAPGGLRAAPDADALRLFVERVSGLNGGRVAELLRAQLGGTSWQAVLRALCGLEAVVQQGTSAACGEVAVSFQADPASLHAAAASPQAAVRAGPSVSAANADPFAGSLAPAGVQPPLGARGEPGGTGGPPGGLFVGLAVGGGGSAPDLAGGGPGRSLDAALFSAASANPGVPHATSADGLAGLFGGLSTAGPPAPQPGGSSSSGFGGAAADPTRAPWGPGTGHGHSAAPAMQPAQQLGGGAVPRPQQGYGAAQWPQTPAWQPVASPAHVPAASSGWGMAPTHGPAPVLAADPSGITRESTFDFVGDHVSALRTQK
ncbi:hypothetical protein WJX81_007132 [Elliptochloris bilobata]|uniref:ENTH domain-containing protein n=1 Tax=Elliptochloris bilobata TaxID=381761 RepID=A0AAW1S8A7_9CHLO